MSERLSRQYALLGKVETVYGTAETGFTATDAILCSDKPTITFEPDNVDRNLALPWMGLSEQLPGVNRSRIKFSTELVGSGVAGTPPAWDAWMRACGMARTVVAGVCVKYSPINTGHEGLTQRFNKSGVRFTCQGSKGAFDLTLDAYGIPMIGFDLIGFGTTAVEEAVPSVDLSAFIDPQVVNVENSALFKMGATLAADGSLTGGTSLPMKSLSFASGNKLVHRKVLGGERIAIADRAMTGKAVVDLSTTDEVAWRTAIQSIATGAMSFTHGSVAGRKITVHCPRTQRINPQQVEDDGNDMIGIDLRALPGRTGAPEMTIVVW